jgi:hypothetical protein
MELYLFDPVGYERLYNCSAYNVTDIPIEKRQDISEFQQVGTFDNCVDIFNLVFFCPTVWGLIFVVMFVLYEV